MVHKANRDLKAELVEMQLAAQNWEDKYIEAMRRPVCTGMCASQSALVEQLRHELAQCSRELKSCAASLDECRRERGEALDNFKEALDLLTEATDYISCESTGIVLRVIEFEKKHCPLTAEGDTSESDAMDRELADIVGVTEMHTCGLKPLALVE